MESASSALTAWATADSGDTMDIMVSYSLGLLLSRSQLYQNGRNEMWRQREERRG